MGAAERIELEFRARAEAPQIGVCVGIEAAEGRKECARGALPVAQISRELVPAEGVRPAGRHLGTVAFAPVVRRGGLPGIGVDLRFGERSWQACALLIDTHLEIRAPGRQHRVDASETTALAIATVRAVAVGVLVGRCHAAAEDFALPREAAAEFLGAETARARQGIAARLACSAAARNDVDRAARGAGAIEHGTRAAHDLDPFDRFERYRRELRRLEIRFRKPQSIEQHERVLVARDAEAAQVDLRVLRAGEIADLKQPELREDVAETR